MLFDQTAITVPVNLVGVWAGICEVETRRCGKRHTPLGNFPQKMSSRESIAFHFDGQRINVAHRLYADCYNPNLEPEYVKLRFGRDLQTVFVTMSGADGAGSYIVVWALRRNGRHTRTFKPAF